MEAKVRKQSRSAEGWRSWPKKFIQILALLWKYIRRLPRRVVHFFRRTADAAAAVPYLADTTTRTRRSSVRR